MTFQKLITWYILGFSLLKSNSDHTFLMLKGQVCEVIAPAKST